MTKPDKEQLYLDFVNRTADVFWRLENYFGAHGAYEAVVGLNYDDGGIELAGSRGVTKAKEHMKQSWAWSVLSALYEFAYEGIPSDELSWVDLVCFGEEIISLLETNENNLAPEWQQILSLADGRVGLEVGDSLSIEKVALLASVDVRTVRNAISAGDLIAVKSDGIVNVEHNSARTWLAGRRGFKPTKHHLTHVESLSDIASPNEFGTYLQSRRKSLGQSSNDGKLLAFHSSLTPKAISSIEKGAFILPIDAVFPLADYYQIDRTDFLSAVMRVFFNEEFQALTGQIGGDDD